MIQGCDVCQKNKSDSRKPAGLLEPLEIPEQVWADVSMACIIGMPKSRGKDTVLVVVDRLSKYAHFIALSHPYSSKDVAEKFLQHVVKLHGIPKSIVSDRDRVFIGAF